MNVVYTVPGDNLELHEVAALFPEMAPSEYLDFKASIEEKGQLQPIVVYRGKVIDGRHRLRALRELGSREVSVTDYKGDDPAGHVVALNLHRRNLSEAQRAMVGARIANLSRAGRPSEIVGIPTITQIQAAELMNVSRDSINQAKKIAVVPEVAAVVERGGMSLSLATKVAALPEPQRAEILAQEPRTMKAHALALVREPEAVPAQPKPSRRQQYEYDPDVQLGVTEGFAFTCAGMAKMNLDRIDRADPERPAALLSVRNWIDAHLEEP